MRRFRCSGCDHVFTKKVSPDEVEAEYVALYGEPSDKDDLCSLCDDCYAIALVGLKDRKLAMNERFT